MNRLALSVALLSLVGSLEGMKTLSQNVNISCISKDVFCSLESVAIPYCYNEDDFRKKYKNEKVAAAFVCGESSGCYYQGYYSLGVYHECQYIRRLLGNICEKLDFSKAEELIINRQDVVTVYFKTDPYRKNADGSVFRYSPFCFKKNDDGSVTGYRPDAILLFYNVEGNKITEIRPSTLEVDFFLKLLKKNI